jgi:N-acetylneuraminic acid mutarotase
VAAGELTGTYWRSGTAVALDSGGALVIGYDEAERKTMTTELWDPATARWRPTAALERPRTQFAAVALAGGRVLVVGGFNEADASYSSSYIYDAASETWTKAGLMVTARAAPAAAVLPDGRVLVAGGYFYQRPESGQAPPHAVLAAYVPPPAEPRATPAPPYDVDAPPHGYALATAEIFDPATATWSATGSMSFARTGAAAVSLSDGRVLVVGSAADEVERVDARAYENAELYDPRTGRFTMAGSLPEIDREAIARDGVILPDGDPAPANVGKLVPLEAGDALLVAHSGWWKHEGDVDRTFRFASNASGWTQVGPAFATVEDREAERTNVTPGVARVGAFVVRLGDGRVLVAGAGGKYSYASTAEPTAELFDPATDTWTPAPDLPEPRLYGTAVALADGSALLIGGSRDEQTGEGWESIELRSAVRFVPAE